MEDGATAKVWTKLLRLSREEERHKLKDDGWNAAPGSDANWSSLVNKAAENDSKYDFKLFLSSETMKSSAPPPWLITTMEPVGSLKNPSRYHGKTNLRANRLWFQDLAQPDNLTWWWVYGPGRNRKWKIHSCFSAVCTVTAFIPRKVLRTHTYTHARILCLHKCCQLVYMSFWGPQTVYPLAIWGPKGTHRFISAWKERPSFIALLCIWQIYDTPANKWDHKDIHWCFICTEFKLICSLWKVIYQ